MAGMNEIQSWARQLGDPNAQPAAPQGVSAPALNPAYGSPVTTNQAPQLQDMGNGVQRDSMGLLRKQGPDGFRYGGNMDDLIKQFRPASPTTINQGLSVTPDYTGGGSPRGIQGSALPIPSYTNADLPAGGTGAYETPEQAFLRANGRSYADIKAGINNPNRMVPQQGDTLFENAKVGTLDPTTGKIKRANGMWLTDQHLKNANSLKLNGFGNSGFGQIK